MIFSEKIHQKVAVHHFNVVDPQTDDLRIDVEHPYDGKTFFVIFRVICQRLSEISRPDDDHLILSVKSENRIDFLIKTFDVVSVPLLAEAAEIV